MFTVFRTCVLFAVIFLFTFVAALFACGDGVMSGGVMGGGRAAPAKPSPAPVPVNQPTKIAPPTVTLKESPLTEDAAMTGHLHGLIGERGREIAALKKQVEALTAKLNEPKDGKEGAPGRDGKDGATPVIPAPIVNVPAPVVNVPQQPAPVVNVTIDTTALVKAFMEAQQQQNKAPMPNRASGTVKIPVSAFLKKE